MDPNPAFLITDPGELSALYGSPLERSVRKQMDHLDDLSRAFIAASPLLVLATSDGVSLDASPRGDAPGFVQVADDHTLLIPDRRGNNRLDSLRNIVRNPQVGLLFLVPGVRETFRVNGEAMLSRDPELTAWFSVQDKLPKTVIVVRVKEAYIHCSRALVRAELWNAAKHAAPGAVPTFGAMLEAHTCGLVKAQQVDEEAVTRVPATLY
jgi:PPOX class probable FMN-dependent enzyme